MSPMAALPESEPDTQPVTQTIGESSSCSEDFDMALLYWGRLYPATRGVGVRDLTEESTVVGKTSSCNVIISEDEVSHATWNVISKKHFSISRTVCKNNDPMINIKIELTDLSLNGTFLNGNRIPKNKPVLLHNDDIIAVAKADFKLFVFKESNVRPDEHRIIHKNYEISRRLGLGSYGEVKLVFSKESGQGYAMKVINKTKFVNIDKKLNIEIKILQKISHPNVIKLVEEYDTPSHKYLILQYMEGGDLCDRITKNKFLPEPLAKLYFFQLIAGMTYLHDKGIVHRDLKPENVLLASNDANTVVKITDFGLSKILESGSVMQTICGTKLYVAPEVLDSTNNAPYTGKVDVWSLGVILFVCLSGKTPFTAPQDDRGKTLEDLIRSGRFTFSDPRWTHVSQDAKLLIRKMMTRNPSRRITVENIKINNWLKDKKIETDVKKLIENFGFVDNYEGLQVNKENKRLLNCSSEEIQPPKRPKLEKMDFI